MTEHRHDDTGRWHRGGEQNSSWKNYVLHLLWAVVVAIMGWFLTEGATERANVRADTQRIEQKQFLDNARISVLEEQLRNQRETLQRIEDGVDELRREKRGR